MSAPLGLTVNAGQWATVTQMISRSERLNCAPATPGALPIAGSTGNGLTAEALATAIDHRRKPKFAHINMSTMLASASLATTAAATLPKSVVVDEIGAEVSRLREGGVAVPFPFCDLKRLSPPWALAVLEPGRCTPFSIWAASLHRWALAMECTGLARFTSCQAHQDNCLRVAEEARAAGKSAQAGQLYDVIVRKKLADLAHAGMVGFNVNEALVAFDPESAAAAEKSLVQLDNKHRRVLQFAFCSERVPCGVQVSCCFCRASLVGTSKVQGGYGSGKHGSSGQVWSGTPPRGQKRHAQYGGKDDSRSGSWGGYASKGLDASSGGYESSKGGGRDGGKAGGGKRQRY